MARQTVAFIGAGNMAGSLIGGWLGATKATGEQRHVKVADVSREQLDNLTRQFPGYSIETMTSNTGAIEGADLVVVAVKPNVVKAVCEDIGNTLAQTPLVSVAAGVRCEDMIRWLGSAAGNNAGSNAATVIRCMPNTPALLSAGVTGLYAGDSCSDHAKNLASEVLQAVGKVVWVNEESALDAVTAVSGSGPAYFFAMLEHMSKTGVELGLDEAAAMNLAIETAYGAALMARQGELPPATLRENVTSKNGTTAAALASFENDHFGEVIQRGMVAARDRAKAMGDEFGKD